MNTQAIINLQNAVNACNDTYQALESATGKRNRAAQDTLNALCAVAIGIKQADTPAERKEIMEAGYTAIKSLPAEAQKGLLDSRMYADGDYITLGQFVNIDSSKGVITAHADASARALQHWADNAENGIIYPKAQGGKKLPAKKAHEVCLQASAQFQAVDKPSAPNCLKIHSSLEALIKACAAAKVDAVRLDTLKDIARPAFESALRSDEEQGRATEEYAGKVEKAKAYFRKAA